MLAVSGNAVGKTPAELLLWARNLGDKGGYGTPGVGTVGHLGMALLKTRTSIAPQHMPFNGNPQVIEAMLAGKIQLALLPPGLTQPLWPRASSRPSASLRRCVGRSHA